MQAQDLIILLEDQRGRINTLVQTVKGNSFSNGQKTAVINAATDAIDDGTTIMTTELRDFIDETYTAPVAYDDTAAVNTNVPIKKPIIGQDLDGIRVDLAEAITKIEMEILQSETENISNSITNEIFTRTSDYNDAVDDYQTALAALKTALFA